MSGDGLNGEDRRLLVQVARDCSEIKGRLDEIKDAQERDVRALHHRASAIEAAAASAVVETEARLSKRIAEARADARAHAVRWGGGAGTTIATVIALAWQALKDAIWR